MFKKVALGAVIVTSLGFVPAVAALPDPAIFTITSSSLLDTARNNASVTLKGTKPAELISYTVTATASGQSSVKLTVTPPASSTSWEIPVTGLAGGVNYTFVVTTTNGDGSRNSDPKTFIAQSIPAFTSATAVAGIKKATISWVLADDGGSPITSYVISGGGKTYTSDPTKSTYEVTGLTDGQSGLVFDIIAVNAIGSSAKKPMSSIDIPSAPGTPTNVDAISQDDGSVKVSWTAPSNDGKSTITGYSVTLSPANGSDLTTTVAAVTEATFTSVGVGIWTAKVQATNLVGTGVEGVDASPLSVSAVLQALSLSPTPTISGTLAVGQSISAVSGTWDAGVTLAYQWKQDDSPIPGANSATYILTNSNLGGIISVSVTGNKTGYASITRTSASSVAVIAQQQNNSQNNNSAPAPSMPPVVAPVPSPTPSATPSPTPSATPTATPTPSASPKPSPSATPVVTPSPTPSSSAVVKSVLPAKEIPANGAVSAVPPTVKPMSVVQITPSVSTKTTSIKKNSTIALSLPSVPKGTAVKQVLVGPDGKSYTLVSGKTSSTGQVSSPTLKFAKAGTYTLTVTIGTKKKIIKIVVK